MGDSEKDIEFLQLPTDQRKMNSRTHNNVIANMLVIDKNAQRQHCPRCMVEIERIVLPRYIPLDIIIVLVAAANHDHCSYVSLLVTHPDKGSAVISRAMKKLSMQGSPSHYALYQSFPRHKQVSISLSANVYYALSKQHSYAPGRDNNGERWILKVWKNTIASSSFP